jgi:hypothetical protein
VSQRLLSQPGFYTSNWDNSLWAVLAQLLGMGKALPQQLAGSYRYMLQEFVKAWKDGKVPVVSQLITWLGSNNALMRRCCANTAAYINIPALQIMPPSSSTHKPMDEIQALRQEQALELLVARAAAAGPDFRAVQDSSGKATFIAPLRQQCIPDTNGTAAALLASGADTGRPNVSDPDALPAFLPHRVRWEASCEDSIDNDCDGLIDSEDPDCGFRPVTKTAQQLSWSPTAPLPNAAAAALVALAYARSEGAALDRVDKTRLQCWALGQATYLVGGSGRSYVVGLGRQAPQRVAHMSSACPASGPCSWYESYYSASPNPQAGLMEGALVGGPDARDGYSDERASAGAAVGVHYNAPFVGALAGLLDSGVSAMACMKLYTVYGIL